MALAIAGAAALGGTALAAYLDAKFHARNDINQGSRLLTLFLMYRALEKKTRENKLLLYNILEDRAGTSDGERVFLVFEGRQWTYNEFFKTLQPIGNWFVKDLGIKQGETVALDGGNSPEYIMLWLALEAVGAIPAFVNCNLTSKPLKHCIELCKARYVLADNDILQLISPIENELSDSDVQVVYYSPTFLSALKDSEPLPVSRRQKLDPLGPASLMYTSGTTGLPKAVVVTRARENNMMAGGPQGLTADDTMYTCLPLYHAAAHGLCVVPCIGKGATVVLSRKFSHKTFWPEVHASGATWIQYVGELCRYLVNAPPSPLDKGHKVRGAWGNGMRPDIWERFRERFGIEIIHELYAASDGVNFMANMNRGDFSRNAVSIRGPIWHLLNGRYEKRVRIDPDTEEILRGKDGFAIECKAGEAGEMLGMMDPTNPDRGTPQYFENRKATLARRVADVFKKGDLWYRSGDLMRQDAEGRLYFVDRLGDTYRWHSENVSTNEVSDVVGLFPQIAEANVYGVLVPNADGRAGCAAIVPTEDVIEKSRDDSSKAINWKALTDHCIANLPRYAVPLFVRVVRQLEYTGTMKLQKSRLRSEGIEVDAIERAAKEKDEVFWLPPGASSYQPFSRKDLEELRNGRVRL